MTKNTELTRISRDFIQNIEDRKAVIAIVGLGYVGLPLAMGFHSEGFSVLGIDIDEVKVTNLTNGKSYIAHFSDEQVGKLSKSDNFTASTDFSLLQKADAILLCIPTPLNKHRDPDLSFVVDTAEAVAEQLRNGQIVILESTTYPGTTSGVLQPILEKGSGLKANRDFVVAYSPEREDPANPDYNTATIPKVIGASTYEGQEMAAALYLSMINKVVHTSSPETAEAVKLTENIFRAVNIALVNELKLIYTEMGIDVWEVIDAAATKPFGFMPFYPGPGLGGHCIPIDPFYLTWKAKEYDRHTRFIELAGEINRNMPKHVIAKLAVALSQKSKLALNGAKILIVGIAYKKNVDDIRESPSLTLMKLLQAQGAEIGYYDPYVGKVSETREYPEFTGMESIEFTQQNLQQYDAALIATDHSNIDWKKLADNAQLIVDTRNVMAFYSKEYGHKIVKS